MRDYEKLIERMKGLAPTHNLKQVAQVLDMSPKYLSRVFKQKTGVDFVRLRVIEKVRVGTELMLNGEPLKVAAQKAGYKNQETFIRMFKSCYGVTPGIYYRKRHPKDIKVDVLQDHERTVLELQERKNVLDKLLKEEEQAELKAAEARVELRESKKEERFLLKQVKKLQRKLDKIKSMPKVQLPADHTQVMRILKEKYTEIEKQIAQEQAEREHQLQSQLKARVKAVEARALQRATEKKQKELELLRKNKPQVTPLPASTLPAQQHEDTKPAKRPGRPVYVLVDNEGMSAKAGARAHFRGNKIDNDGYAYVEWIRDEKCKEQDGGEYSADRFRREE